jgi:signal transduction histidine kinase
MQAAWKNKHTPYEVISALTDFARLSQQASALLSSSLETPDTLALAMLTRLLSLCHASQGTFLLSFQTHGIGRRPLSTALLADQHLFPLMIHYKMNEESVVSALAHFAPDGPDIQIPPAMPHIIIWRHLLDRPAEEGEWRSAAQHTPMICAFFVLAWPEKLPAHASLNGEEDLLPLIADAVDAVIVNMLLALRVHDLEQIAQRKAEQANELLKAELLATVSHELRSPLASIKGYTTTLLRHEKRISPEERHEFLVAISSASTRLETIVNRLLEVSQLETQTIHFEPVQVNLIHLVQEALTAVRHFVVDEATLHAEVASHPMTYTLHIEQEYNAMPNDGLIVQGDRRLLRNLLDHLLENATQHSSAHGKIEVGLRSIQQPQALAVLEQQLRQEKPTQAVLPSSQQKHDVPLVEIWVKDSGSGIPPEHLYHIFDRFYRVDMSLVRAINGLGLGLSICKSIVELHRGTIWVESEPGKGSAFHVLLPQNEHRSQVIEETV